MYTVNLDDKNKNLKDLLLEYKGLEQCLKILTERINSDEFSINNLPRFTLGGIEYYAKFSVCNIFIHINKNKVEKATMRVIIKNADGVEIDPRELDKTNCDWVRSELLSDKVTRVLNVPIPYRFMSDVKNFLEEYINQFKKIDEFISLYYQENGKLIYYNGFDCGVKINCCLNDIIYNEGIIELRIMVKCSKQDSYYMPYTQNTMLTIRHEIIFKED